MPPKRILLTPSGEPIKEKKYKAPVKPFIESAAIIEYRTDRDICYYIQHGGECLWSEEEIKEVKDKYFKGYEDKLF
jgi:hypothetical protein